MKLKALLVTILLMSGYMFGQTSPYPLVTLHDINFQGDTATAYWNSPMAGDTIRVRGTLLVTPIISPLTDRRTIFYYAAAYGCWIQDASSAPWTGLEIYQSDTSDVAKATGFDLCDTAKTYEFTGVVTPYGQATELALITKPVPIPVDLVSEESKRPDPIPLTMDSCWDAQGHFNLALRKYQGMYVSFNADATHPLITSDLITGQTSTAGGFKFNDTLGHSLSMYAQSKYYRTGTSYTLRPGYTPPPNGSRLPYVRGVLEAYMNTSGVWTWEVVPMYPGDLGDPVNSPPAISLVTRDPGVVPFNDSVKVTCQVVGLVGAKVTSVKLFTRINGIEQSPITMNQINGALDSNYTCTIPAITSGDSTWVDYYVQATDNDNLSSTSPQNITASRFSYFVFSDNRPLTLQHVRYSPYGSAYSSYNGYHVTVTGVVTADTSNIPGSNANNPPRVFIQNGTGPWSGIELGLHGNMTNNIYALKQGDLITVSGTPKWNGTYGTSLDTVTSINFISHNNDMPAPHELSTNEVGISALGALTAEPWNGCIVTYKAVTIDVVNADGPTINYGESFITDSAGGTHTRVTWSDGRTRFNAGPTSQLVNLGDSFATITGILGYTHANYKICPRNDNDITGYINDVKDNKNVIPAEYKLNQNFPNPFNPSTTISYDIPKSGMVTIKIFNVLGQQVRTLVNHSQVAGSHQVNFNASSLNSGVYFYSLTVDNFTQVKKMMLIK